MAIPDKILRKIRKGIEAIKQSTNLVTVYRDADDYMSIAEFPKKTKYNVKKLFKEVSYWLLENGNLEEPKIVIWAFVRHLINRVHDKAQGEEITVKQLLFDEVGYTEYKEPEIKEDFLDDIFGEDGNPITVAELMEKAETKEPIDIRQEKIKMAGLKESFGKTRNRISKANSDITAPEADTNAFLVSKPATEDEKQFLLEREAKYRNDYTLNNSSDTPLLQELLYCELVLKRMNEYLRANPGVQIIEQKQLIFKQLMSAMDSLGVSRKKRIEDEEDLKDNITDAVETYEHYAKHIDEFELYFCLTELEMLLQRFDRNELPEYLFVRYTYGVTPQDAKKIYDEFSHMIPSIEKKIRELQI